MLTLGCKVTNNFPFDNLFLTNKNLIENFAVSRINRTFALSMDIQQQRKNIGSLFDRIALHYDGLNHILSLNVDKLWRRQGVRSLKGHYVHCLDIATGTADLAIALVRSGKVDNVTGADLSSEMMRIGAEKVARKKLSDVISFQLADCAELPFDDSTFDLVTCSYGVRNFARLDESLCEIFRVLRPSGELMILEFAYPSNRLIRGIYDFYFTRILPLVGKMISRDASAYEYLPTSVKHFIYGADFTAHLQQAGFSNATFKSQTFSISMLYRAKKNQ